MPTINSKNINGNGNAIATIADIDANNTSPAKTLPNNLNDNDATLAISDTISITPTKKCIGLTIIIVGSFLILPGISIKAFKLINLLK